MAPALILPSGCRAPTEILLDLRTDVDCRDISATTIAVGTLDDLERRPIATSTSACTLGRIGTLMLVPSGDNTAEVAVRVVTAFSKTPEDCVRDGYKGGCIVARRALRYVPHETLELPVLMEASCVDVPCGSTETCRGGRCTPATLTDPGRCTDPAGCGGAAGASALGGAGSGSGGMPGHAGEVSTCSPACENPNGDTTCVDGACVPQCAGGYDDCDGNPGNGCETDLGSDDEHCGACNAACPAEDGIPVCEARECKVGCDLNGSYALKVTLDTTWRATAYVQDGAGTFHFWFKVVANHDGEMLDTRLTECGRLVPEFYSAVVNETYQSQFPASLFDSMPPYLGASRAQASVTGPFRNGKVSLPTTAFVMGTTLADSLNDPWPSSARNLTPVDLDGDAKPGVTVLYRNDGGHSYPRTDGSLIAPRAERPYIASRLAFSLQGELTSCTRSAGSADVRFVDTRVFGCSLASSERDCDGAQADFLNQNRVEYDPGGATYEMVRVAENAVCSEIREQL